MVAPLTLAITGGTGFVGAHLIDAALAAGHRVRALTRRRQDERDGVAWIAGSLDDGESLAALAAGADAVIHVAGVLNVPTAEAFEAGNVAGTRAMLDAAAAGSVRRFVHVSSLAAREPQLSMYGASKARAETLVRTGALDWAIVRPPAVYGPGDRETLDLFRMAVRGLVLMPPQGAASYIQVGDLARLLVALADPAAPSPGLVEPDDGHPGGWPHRAFAAELARAVGRRALAVNTPRPLLDLAARADRLVRGAGAKLSADRVSYFCHPDWVANPARAVPRDLWQAQVALPEGLAATARWYRDAGWL